MRPAEQGPGPTAARDQRTVELIADAAERDPDDRRAVLTKAVELNMPLARYLARKYQRLGIPDDDLQQVAYLGLLKAVRGFSPQRANSFAAYAIPTIRGELRRHFRDTGWMVRPPRRVQEVRARVRVAESELTQGLGRAPSVNEIADRLGLEIDDVREASSVASCYTPVSLDASVFESDELTIEPAFEDSGFARAEVRSLLEDALDILSQRDRLILDLRFVDGLTQREIGQMIGVSQMQVSRILARILGQMRTAILGEAA